MSQPLINTIIAMLIWGTIGIVRKNINMPSSFICLDRALIGALFLLIFMRIRGITFDRAAIRRNFKILFLSGICMGFNWTLLFEAFKYTSVAVAVLCYYMAPVIVILASAVLFKERLTWKNCICISAAFIGMILVSDILKTDIKSWEEVKGIVYALGAALLYASVVLFNKKVTGIGAYDKTFIQLMGTAFSLAPFCFLTLSWADIQGDLLSWELVAVVGVVHTGIAITLFFGAIDKLKAQTTALLSYFDPVSSLIFAAIFLGEQMTVYGYLGAVLILGSTLANELVSRK